jgi:hypothetical protein
MKYALLVIYQVIAVIYMLVDMAKSYGDDSLLFWLFVRPFISVIKGILWIFFIW